MTYEEAKGRISKLKLAGMEKCVLGKFPPIIHAFNEAEIALDRLILAKPRSTKEEKTDPTESYWCSRCATFLFKEWAFCPVCGQAIDWSEEKKADE